MPKHTKKKLLDPAVSLDDTPQTTETDELIIDYDGIWKLIIEEFFPEFMEFFLPKLFADIDFTQPPEFLDKELL